MDDQTEPRVSRLRRWTVSAALVGAGLLAGGVLVGNQLAQAADGTTSTASSTSGMNPAAMSHGPGEKLLTGSTASDIEAAALKAVPNGTIIRVETDSDGATYEAHVQKTDGTQVTVKFDKNLTVTEIVDGFGAGPQGTLPSTAA